MADGYPRDWNKRRKLVYRRDNYQCQRCGQPGGPRGNAELHCHHIRPKSQGGSHHPSNLKTLCWRCHNRVHRHHVPRKSSRRSRSKTTSSTDSGSSSRNQDSTEVEIRTHRGLGNALLKGFLAFLAFTVGSMWLLDGLIPEKGPLAELYALTGFLVWFTVTHADFSKRNTPHITSLAGYSVFVIWLSFTFFRGIFTLLSTLYFFGIFAIVIFIVTELGWISGKPEDSHNGTTIDVISKIGYVILSLSSWSVAWWLSDHVIEALHIVDTAEQTLTSTPTPVSWIIADQIQSISATFTLSITLFAIFFLRSIANAISISRAERWSITSIQFLLTIYVSREILKLSSIATTTSQIALSLLLLIVCLGIALWTPLTIYSKVLSP
ncbi:hypothetical protein BRC82_05370 [Halobacteriales archaeon QS_1_67_19]|nr:MAG: hypothetical protein BRC82_05370 [Halobacteriales archaeon QS_1_67_19]